MRGGTQPEFTRSRPVFLIEISFQRAGQARLVNRAHPDGGRSGAYLSDDCPAPETGGAVALRGSEN